MRVLKFAITAALLALSACVNAAAPQPAQISRIVSTTSFGMCLGYCTTTLEISEHEAVLIREARDGRGASDLPDQRFTTTLTPAEWAELSRLAASTDMSALPPTIGCPDCADGGAETLSINGAAPTNFEYNATIPEAQALLTRVRALRARLMPAG